MPRTFHVYDWVGHEILGFCFNLFCLFPVMPKVRRNIRPEGVIGVGGFLGRGAVGRRGPCKDIVKSEKNWPKNMKDLQQMLQRHGDTNGNLCENFYVDTGPAGLFSLHTCHVLLFLLVSLRLAPGAGGI